jgi:hypothetical protein
MAFQKMECPQARVFPFYEIAQVIYIQKNSCDTWCRPTEYPLNVTKELKNRMVSIFTLANAFEVGKFWK